MIFAYLPSSKLKKKKLWKGQLEAGLRGGFFISLGVEHCVAHGANVNVVGTWVPGTSNVTSIHVYRKIPKISPGAYMFQRPFLRGLFLEGLVFGWAYLRKEICILKLIQLAL